MDPVESRLSDKRNREYTTNTPWTGEDGTVTPTGTDIADTTRATRAPRSTTMDPTPASTGSNLGSRNKNEKSTMNDKSKTDELASQAEHKAEAGMQKTAEGLKKAAEKTRSMSGDQGGSMESIGDQAADMMEKGANYLEHGDTEQMMQDLEAFVRRRPVESLLVAAGAGFIIAKAMK